MTILERAQQALRADQCDGWLLYNIYHRDHLADFLLGVPPAAMNTRPWACWIPAAGPLVALVHAIEADVLADAPVDATRYTSQEQLHVKLRAWLRGQSRYALNFSAIPALSVLDYATVETFRSLVPSALPISAEGILQRTLGVLDPAGVRAHETAAHHLYAVVQLVWQRLRQSLLGAHRVTEGDLQDWILDQFATRGLVTEHDPIVAVAGHSADPHYQPVGGGAAIVASQVVQLDLWAKQPGAAGIYADISWVGYTGSSVPTPLARAFAAVAAARDAVAAAAGVSLAAGDPPSGEALDLQARAVLESHGLLKYVRHRTGHALDRLLHGIGVNLDAIEFPDSRNLLDGSCFSVEPGVYGVTGSADLVDADTFGVRTEINAYIDETRFIVSGGAPQTQVLSF